LRKARQHGTAANAQSAGNAKDDASTAPRFTGIDETPLAVAVAVFVAFAASSAETCGEAEARAATVNLRRRGVDGVVCGAPRRGSRLPGELPKAHARDFDVAIRATTTRGASAGRAGVTRHVIAVCARLVQSFVSSDALHSSASTWKRSRSRVEPPGRD
jgi:hypothetical protein